MEGNMKVTVLNGKESVVLEIPTPTSTDGQWLKTLQDQVALRCGVEIAHQKLLFRGKQLSMAHAPQLQDGSKLMLLKNASFHKSGAGTSKPNVPVDAAEAELANAATQVPQKVVVTQRVDVDPADIDDDHVLIQATRGKSLYEFLFEATATIATVKTRVGGALGLPGGAIRLLLKAKTPSDDAVLSSFLSSTTANRVLKCMVLLNAKQHDLMEREDEFRAIQNELTSVRAQAQKLKRVMVRNLVPREEVLLQLHVVQDRVGQLKSNVEIVREQLQATKLTNATTQTALVATTQACEELFKDIESLTARFESGR